MRVRAYDEDAVFVDVSTGTILYSSDDFTPGVTGVALGNSTYLAEYGEIGLLKDGSFKPIPGQFNIFEPEAHNGPEGFFVAARDRSYENDGAIGYFDISGEFRELIPADLASSLGASVRGAADGLIYVDTTSELIAIGLDGEQVGDAISSVDGGPSGDRLIGDQVWTLWGRWVDGVDAFVTNAPLVAE